MPANFQTDGSYLNKVIYSSECFIYVDGKVDERDARIWERNDLKTEGKELKIVKK